MSILTIPLLDATNQTFTVKIDDKDCSIRLYESSGYLYMDLIIPFESSSYGSICLNNKEIKIDRQSILRSTLYFQDVEGSSDPVLTGLGTRYFLRVDNGIP